MTTSITRTLALGALVFSIACSVDDAEPSPSARGAHLSGCVEVTRERVTLEAERMGIRAATLDVAQGDWTLPGFWMADGEKMSLAVRSVLAADTFFVEYEPADPKLSAACPDRFERAATVSIESAEPEIHFETDALAHTQPGGEVVLLSELRAAPFVELGKLAIAHDESADVEFYCGVAAELVRCFVSGRIERSDGSSVSRRAVPIALGQGAP